MVRRRKGQKWPGNAGATLLEILVVLSIIALLAAVVGPRVVGYLSRAKSTTTEMQLDNLKQSLELFYVDLGRYPTEREGLQALVTAPGGLTGWSGPYLESSEGLADPWGRDYLYRAPGEAGRPFDVLSLGRDGVEGGQGEDADLKL
ncbi:MAG: type II secretion system major pseudopilin GspG [Pseudomonadota bacterium]